jgi:hypothetical protein
MMYTMEILKQLDRLEFDFFDHTSYSTIPFYHYHKKFLYICTSCVGVRVPADVLVLGTV